MGYAPVPTEKCAAWLRRSVLTIGPESKERKAGGTGWESWCPRTSFYLFVQKLQAAT